MLLNTKAPRHLMAKVILEARSLLMLVAFAILASSITYVLYKYTEELLKDRLQERLVAIASTAAVQFNPEDIQTTIDLKDPKTAALRRIVNQLIAIRNANKNIKFAYIMSRTTDPLIYEFVADADMLSPTSVLDENANGVLDDEEIPPQPGDPYEVSEYPVLRDEAFDHPSVDRELQPDKWGLIMAAYAPIVDKTGQSIAVIGLDVLVNDFKQRTQETLLPFILFISFLILLLTLLTMLLVRFWLERVNALSELDRQKDELLSIVSHQLAAPVTAIKWYLELLTDSDMGSLKKEQVETVKSMQGITVNLADLVSMILDVSRIQLGRMKTDQQPLDLNIFFREILDVIEPKAKEKKVQFMKSMPKDLPTVLLDKRLTRMTVENLLTNAVKYTPENGQVKFTVEQRGKILYCEVRDTGCGIPKKEQENIFGKMFRASNVRNSVDGNGFGLYVAKGAIESQGGKIWFESVESKGTAFYIELPLFFPKSDDLSTP